MSADEKPFACREVGCGMRFTNEDHLAVHRKKHEMCLSLSTTLNQKSTAILDQTPTPTRFIRNCEEVGLFQDLQNVNPFDEQFRKANQQSHSTPNLQASSLMVPSEPTENDTLNTPSVFPISMQPETVGHVVKPMHAQDDDEDILIMSGAHNQQNTSPVKNQARDEAPRVVANPNQQSTPILLSKIPSTTVGSTKVPVSVAAPPLVSVTPAPVTLEIPAETLAQQIQTNKNIRIAPQQKVILPQAVVVNNPTNQQTVSVNNPTNQQAVFVNNPTNQQAMVINNPANQTSNITVPISSTTNKIAQFANKPMNMQVVLRLQDGTDIPIQIPEAGALQSSAISTTKEVSSQVAKISQVKQKLKQALNQNQIPAKHIKTAPEPMIMDTDNISAAIESANSSNNNFQSSSNNRIRRRSSEEDPDEKRQKFLERNRAAATRCRLKRKYWVDSLEAKADQLSKHNIKLQREVKSLKEEVANLKTMLLAHKECPVTLQQIREANNSQLNDASSTSFQSAGSIIESRQESYLIVEDGSGGQTSVHLSESSSDCIHVIQPPTS